MFINGEWVIREDLEVFNPYTYETIGKITSLSRDEVKYAIEVANEHKEFMKNLSPSKRYNLLMNIAKEISENKEKFARTISLDVGKPIKQSIIEVDRTLTTFRLSAFYAKELRGETIPFEEGIILTKREPVGVVGAITPFNFPLNLITHKVGPAFATGNSIVLHPSSKAPMAAIELTKVIEKVLKKMKIPLGVFNLTTGEGPVVGDEISKNEKINMVSFTGSVEVGELITKNAGIKKVSLELGGNNPMIVLKDSNIEEAAKAAVKSKFLNAGQVCISVGKVLVEEEIADQFIDQVIAETKKLNVGNPLDRTTDVGPLITLESAERVENLINQSIEEGGKLLFGGERNNSIIYPTVMEVNEDNILSKVEVFGPVLPIIKVKDENEAIEIANNTEYGLQAGVFTNDINRALKLADSLEYGGVMINNSPTFRRDNMPFGGIKKSGLGREGIKYAVEEMTEIKTIVFNK
ncbi:MAG: lactaldehyde dehydrogenase [Methanothermococcus sp.]|jgi:lactaldehyde dehydrogenase|uniref:lactaldehyde dehydrogenase n=1 Tax=Methanothermococcus TaxID=155862 RepID=UPI00037FDBA2|nr:MULTISPECIES: lactaldehyde dehydrogenase [Methanothermococcus]MDK2789698.1 lactaldehyde dehydrogenase [Methanothermococcus sp.]MDK2988426.1 lactaldehyde dehydrogenase [Methanothermococcus sp.]